MWKRSISKVFLLIFLIHIRFLKEDEDKEEEVNSGSECGDDVEVDVCAIERIPALCSRCDLV